MPEASKILMPGASRSVLDEERFQNPPGLVTGTFLNEEGRIISFDHATPSVAGARARCAIWGGFREPKTKYNELMREQLAERFEVWRMDLPDQGESGRFLPDDPMKSHHLGYGESIATVDRFMRDIMGPSNLPTFILTHSMGGHVALRYLKECSNAVTAAAMTAPMIEFRTGVPPCLAWSLVERKRRQNALDQYVLGGRAWKEEADVFRGNKKTSDPVRFQVQSDLYRIHKELRKGDPTYGWLDESHKSVLILNREDYLGAIKTPILMGIAGRDRIVKSSACRQAAKWLPNCEAVDIQDALHEVWMERDDLRGPHWRARVNQFQEMHIQAFSRPLPAPRRPGGPNQPR